jgi:hypothetical protein
VSPEYDKMTQNKEGFCGKKVGYVQLNRGGDSKLKAWPAFKGSIMATARAL